MTSNAETNDLLFSFAKQGLTVGQILAELKSRRVRGVAKNRVAYYVNKARKEAKASTGETGVKSAKLAKGSDFQRALKVLEADVLTADEKVSIATMILKAKPTA